VWLYFTLTETDGTSGFTVRRVDLATRNAVICEDKSRSPSELGHRFDVGSNEEEVVVGGSRKGAGAYGDVRQPIQWPSWSKIQLAGISCSS